MAERVTKPRETAVRKRASVLDAARDLFLRDGYERTSVDAISARANVSKRTAYDYFGDKQSIYRAVVERELSATMAAVELAIAEELIDGIAPADALLSFARRIATEVLQSSPYAMLRRLSTLSVTQETPFGREFISDPEELLGARLADYARAGLLRIGNPRRAADQFSALTFLLALDAAGRTGTTASASGTIDEILKDGVSAFIRAYAA